MGLHQAPELWEAHRARLPPQHCCLPEQHKRGYTLHAHLLRQSGLFIHIYLDDGEGITHFLLQLSQHRSHHLARPTPGCKKIYQYWFFTLYQFGKGLRHVVRKIERSGGQSAKFTLVFPNNS